ncbi:NUMOD3 domain-containing DNA-binding protein [Halolamina salifodinae]|uniref:5-methylcytosine-specific restriction endonuclease McrA n=1 Tax=Halolamina salifodinae TaxID=1202767 RepID=A0A8T4GZ03_9EURY|nr:NUMOD3 domain-containing DNA-binding protein [Halolamina salifodinae]MBP1988211.1 5-methylcytosine-specific restriction endonuclease McrA [Halolamina salifodinae]
MGRRYRNGWWLEQKYWVEGLTQAEIAEECGVSARCIRKWMQKRGVETRELVGENHPQHGCERDEETKEKISETMEGREFPQETIERFREARRGSELPEETRERISESLTGLTRPESTREKMSEARTGERNPRWKGSISESYGPGWDRARRRVRERDELCQNRGDDGSNRRLDVHHIVPFRLFDQANDVPKSAAHDPGNLVLLCRPCHRKAERDEIEFHSSLEPPE